MIFLGLLFPRWEEKSIREKSKKRIVQNQVNTYQWNCIDGIYENLQKGVRIINALPVGTFPCQYKDIILNSKEWIYKEEKHYQVGSINLPLLKQYFRYKKIKKLLQKSKDKEICIYSMYLPFLKAVQKLDKSYHVKLIVPDLPEYYDYSGKEKGFKKYLRKRNNKAVYKCLKRVDSFVLLTEQMKEPLKVGNKPYVIVEGISNYSIKEIETKERKEKILLYTGSLNQKFGIDVLLQAFMQTTNKDYRLWICGSGDYEQQIKHFVSKDDRIKFFGYVSKIEAEKKQQEALVLINPRQNNGDYTKYSFPSKTIECLASGKPFIAYKLDGIPEEYDKYINYVEENSIQALQEKITQVFENLVDYKMKAQKAVEFIQTKTAKEQAKKIINLGK